MTHSRKKLKRILEKKISRSGYLKMHFYFFLMSFLGCPDVKRLFRKHKIMKLVEKTSEHYNYNWNDNGGINTNKLLLGGNRIYSIKSQASQNSEQTYNGDDIDDDGSSPPTATLLLSLKENNENDADDDDNDDFKQYHPLQPIKSNNKTHKRRHTFSVNKGYDQTVIFAEKDPVKLFRLPIDKFAVPGFRVIVPKKLQYKFYDPINGNKNVSQLKVIKIFNSNAKPLLIECFL